ncbi:MAG: L,D-transpeptidase family protein [Rhodospirillales bacterium]|nr:L,D-transpeptidase family protein [Rhodospirillales bacterium]
MPSVDDRGSKAMRAAALITALVVPAAAGAESPAGAALAHAGGDLIGELKVYQADKDDIFPEIARRFDLGYVELVAANPGIDPWVPGDKTRLLLPSAHLLPDAPRAGIVINLAEQRLYYFPPSGATVASFPLGIGRLGWETPLGETRIVRKRENPTWIPPASIRAERPNLPAVVPPGPWNPLGEHALNLGWESFVIHGTNKPDGIGRRVSHGCIRLYPEDIAWLFGQVEVNTRVTVVDQSVKTGWSRGELYLEAHPSQSQSDELEASGRFTPAAVPELQWHVIRAAGEHAARLDWSVINKVARERLGIPVRVTR